MVSACLSVSLTHTFSSGGETLGPDLVGACLSVSLTHTFSSGGETLGPHLVGACLFGWVVGLWVRIWSAVSFGWWVLAHLVGGC